MSIHGFSRRELAGALGLMLAARSVKAADSILVPEGKVRAVLDTDTYNEIDDQFAVAYSMLSPDNIRLEALYAAPFLNRRSTSAGDGMEKSYEEILRVLERLGRTDFKAVYKGSPRFMKDGSGPVKSPAAENLIKRALAADEMLYVMAVGAPTNVASAILMEPKIKDKITVVWLGGRPPHFATAHEFNLQQDPPSSQVFFESGVPLMVVPTTNISEMLRTTTAELAQFIKGKSRIGDYLYEIFVEHAREHKRDFSRPWSKVIWDISAVAWLIDPKWISSKVISSPVLTNTLHWGTTEGRHPMRVATHVDRDRIFGDLFAKIVKAG